MTHRAGNSPILSLGFRGVEEYSPLKVVRNLGSRSGRIFSSQDCSQFGWAQPIPPPKDYVDDASEPNPLNQKKAAKHGKADEGSIMPSRSCQDDQQDNS